MNFRVLCLLAGSAALAGCSSTATGKSPTSQPASTPTVAAVATAPPAAGGTSVAQSNDSVKAGQAAMRRKDYATAVREYQHAVADGHATASTYGALGSAQA